MKKYLLVLFIVLVFSSLAYGQNSIDFTDMGLRGSGGSSDNTGGTGELISVSFSYDYSGITNPNRVYNNTGSGNTYDEIVVIWYQGSSWSARVYDGFNDGITASNVSMSNSTGSGSGSYDFILPSAPTGLTTYFQIFYGCSAPDGFGTYYGDQMTSADDFAGFSAVNNAPSGYFTYMEFEDDTSTEPPTLDLPTSDSVIGYEFDVQYNQPETAYPGSVIITFTCTGGSYDSGSPHIFEVASEASGTKVIGFKNDNLENSPGIESWISGGYTLVYNSVYTITIAYQDLAQNDSESDYNTGITYTTGALLEVSGGDYNAGTSFSPGSPNNAFFRIQMETSSNVQNATVDEIVFTITGSFDEDDVDEIKIWRSDDNSFDANIDSNLDSITSSFAIFTTDFNSSPQTIGNTETTYFFLTIDVSDEADEFDEIGASIAISTDITASLIVSGNFPIEGSTHPLPVTLSSFTVVLSGQPVIYWTTQSETNNAYWNIYRGISQNLGQTIQINDGDMILGQGTSTEPTDYSYIDNYPILENTTYWYWLECVDNAGEADILGPVSLFIPEGNGNNGTPATPDDYGLKQNYPNPFNPDTKINFALVEDSPVRLTIYNIKGEKIKTIFDEFVPADMVQTAYWDGKDESGKKVASGVYLYRLRTNKTEFNRKMLLMK